MSDALINRNSSSDCNCNRRDSGSDSDSGEAFYAEYITVRVATRRIVVTTPRTTLTCRQREPDASLDTGHGAACHPHYDELSVG